MKAIFTILLVVCYRMVFCQSVPLPKGYQVLEEQMGDLDKDGQPEKAIAYDTPEQTEYGSVRELVVYKLLDGRWNKWKSSKNVLLKSQEGGMMGDPFGAIEIKNGILIVSHNGGSSWKWDNTDKYRYQNGEFVLIGYTSNFGKPCEYWASFDFNVSTGAINYAKDYENCDNEENQVKVKTEKETFVKKGVVLNFQNRHQEEIRIVSPKYKVTLHL